jgi:dephospho-CoA kinase
MLKVGLTGGYASGKSFVAAELERLGCFLIYADRLGHAALQPDGAAYRPTVDYFGPEILMPDGSIDRKKLAAAVFPSPDLLSKLEGFVHPAVRQKEEELMAGFAAREPKGIAIVEAAILIETGRYSDFDKLILTACDLETQVTRGMHRDKLPHEQVMARIEKQMPLNEKKRYAQYVINTDGAKQETLRQVKTVFLDLRQLAEASLS